MRRWVSKTGTSEGVGVALETMAKDVVAGDMLLLNDGMITLEVDRIEGTRIHTTVVNGGILSDHKGINKKGGGLSAPALTDVDKENIKLAAELKAEFSPYRSCVPARKYTRHASCSGRQAAPAISSRRSSAPRRSRTSIPSSMHPT